MRCVSLVLLAVLLLVASANAIRVVPNDLHLDVDADNDHTRFLTSDFVSQVNRLANGQWKASRANGHILAHATRAEARKLMGVRNLSNADLPTRVFTAEELAAPLPESFDSAEHWPECPTIREIRDQSSCGSCWAIAAAEAISDRYCTVAKKPDMRISTANLLSCCFVCGQGCNGGWPVAAWSWWVWVGLTTEDCQPYPFPACSHHSKSDKYPACPSEIFDTPKCNQTCTDGSKTEVKYKGAHSYGVSGAEDYMRELMTNGPFEVALDVYEDFLLYKEGVYKHVSGSHLGGHAVRLVGWGVLDGVQYWKVANSWNDDWGAQGYFLIERGTDECGIESSGVAGVPATS